MTNKVLALISKLLAVREERGATEAEQVTAAEAVQRLLQEHNLTLSQVEAHGGEATEKRTKERTGRRAVHRHERDLMACLAENNFCLHRLTEAFAPDGVITLLVTDNPKKAGSETHARYALYHTGMTVRQALTYGVLATDLAWDTSHGFISVDGGRDSSARTRRAQHTLVGREINVGVTLRTYDYLLNAVNRLADDGDYKAHDRVLFAEGAVSRLCARLNELRRERECEEAAARASSQPRTNGTGRELVLSDVYGSEADLNNDLLNGFPTGTTAARRRESQERSARQYAEHDRLVAEGVPSTEAWYRAYGYGEERAQVLARRWDRRGGRGRSQNWSRGDDAHHRRVSSAAYGAGCVAGDEIGLDEQVGLSDRKRIGVAWS